MTSTGEQIIDRFVTTLNERDFDGFEALFVDDYQQHQALATNSGNPAAKHGVRTYYQDRIAAFPDMVITAQPYLVNDEYVAVNLVYSGTHQGAYLGIALAPEGHVQLDRHHAHPQRPAGRALGRRRPARPAPAAHDHIGA